VDFIDFFDFSGDFEGFFSEADFFEVLFERRNLRKKQRNILETNLEFRTSNLEI